jgi:hypothetical protein
MWLELHSEKWFWHLGGEMRLIVNKDMAQKPSNWRELLSLVVCLILTVSGLTWSSVPAQADDQLSAKFGSIGNKGNFYPNRFAFEVSFSGSDVAKANNCKDVMSAIAETSTVSFTTTAGTVSDKLTDYYDSWSPSYPYYSTSTITATSISCIFYRYVQSNPTSFNPFTSGTPPMPVDAKSTSLRLNFLHNGVSLATSDATAWKEGYLGSLNVTSPSRGQVVGKTFSVTFSLDENSVLKYSNLQISVCPQDSCGDFLSFWSFDYGSGGGYVASASVNAGTIRVALTKDAPEGTYFVSVSMKTNFDNSAINSASIPVTVTSKSSTPTGNDWPGQLELINGQSHYINTSVNCGSTGLGFGAARSCKVVLDAQDGVALKYPVSIYETVDGVRSKLRVIQMADKTSASFSFTSPKKYSSLAISAEIDGVNSSIGHWTPAGWDNFPRFSMSVPSSVKWGEILTVKITATKKASGYCDLVTGVSSFTVPVKAGLGTKKFKLVWAGGIGSTTRQFFTATCVSGNHPTQTLLSATTGYR